MSAALLLSLIAASPLAQQELGKAGATCAPNESGPALRVFVDGLKDRRGLLKLELYPSDDKDFLADDTHLVAAGKAFRRIEVPTPQYGPVWLCIRAPYNGVFSLSLLHDRDANHKFGLTVDGAGFTGNPRIGLSKPKAAATAVRIGPGVSTTRIVMNYRHGLLSFGPLKGAE